MPYAIYTSGPRPIDDPESLFDGEMTLPEPAHGELLVKIAAVSVNPVDTKVRRHSQPATPRILGWDAAGVVQALGSEVTDFKVGDKVYYAGALEKSGSNAEYQVVDARLVAKAPESLNLTEAAALPLTAITAWECLFERLRFYADSQGTLLILNGAGGVGSLAIQLARQLTNMTVIATASRPDSINWVNSMGAHHVINHREALGPQLEALGYAQVDSILCLYGTEQYFEQMANLIKPFGQMASIVETANNQPLPMNLLKNKSVSFHWEMMFTRPSLNIEPEAHGRLLNKVARLFDQGVLKSTLTEQLTGLNAANLRKAHARLESGSLIGKLAISAE